MISTKEIMKGCILNYQGKAQVVKGINEFICFESKPKEWIGGSMIEGEPISGIWLDRLGFIKDRNGWHKPGTQFSLTEQFYPCWLDKMLWPQDIPDFKQLSLQYIHQLQLLFFSLTREHLVVPKLK